MADPECMASPTPALAVRGISHAFGRKPALRDLSFEVRAGSFTALLGPNGAGKTTLFSLITGLLAVQDGSISICGRDVNSGARTLASLGLVFQQSTLDLDLSVRQNLAYFASLHGIGQADARRRMDHELERLGMAERGHEKVRTLNGGHRRRVEIARALLHSPSLLLLDEPTVGLDVASRRAITQHVHSLASERGIGVLWTTHLIDEIADDDDLLVLAGGSMTAAGKARDVIRRSGTTNLDEAFTHFSRPLVEDGIG